MTETLLFVGIGTLLMIAVATLGLAAFALQHARRYVELAEARMEHLREVQAILLTFLNEERQRLKEERRPETRREREEREWDTEQDIERRIEQLKGELLQLRAGREVALAGSSTLLEGASGGARKPGGRLEEETSPAGEAHGRAPRPASIPETRASGTAPEDEKPRLAVWHPHPDDDVSPGRASSEQAPARSDVPVKIFRKHYDKYLENYEGYVKLAERIFKSQDYAAMVPGSLAQREWEERLRRVNDGIKRTTARLDILEEYNPELATDDRISRRASIALSHSELERSRQVSRNT
jgi:hypothetical protein